MIKTRFAPSPTGYLHVGGLRTALYAYLFARKTGGKFLLRIEDTDQNRFVEGAIENLKETLEWADLSWDEEPLQQSTRKEIYKKYADELIKNGKAYRCFCTSERLAEMRERQIQNKQAPMYDRKCLDLPQSEIDRLLSENTPHTIRQKMPYEVIKFKDVVRGNVQFDGKTIDDQILMKSDGFPTYHLANVVDDHESEITHVIRGEEWLPSTPKHIALYNAFGWDVPQFAHLPLLLNPDKTKLSKRQGDVAVEDYMKKGYLKPAIINFVAFLGWNPGAGEEKEIYTLAELEEIFTLERVNKSGAVFNLEKLDWFNWQWHKKNIEEKSPEEKANYLFTLAEPHLPEPKPSELLNKALLSVEDKILKDPKTANEHIAFYFELPNYQKELLTHEKMRVDLNQAQISLHTAHEALTKLENWTEEEIKSTLIKTVEKLSVKNGQVLWPLRAALTGQKFSPGVFEIAAILGKEETTHRIQTALTKLSQ